MARSLKKIEGDETTHYVSPRKKRGRPKPKMQPPLTPMIDVTFQLLLFFLLTFTFRAEEGQLPGSLPHKGEATVSVKMDVPDPIRIKLIPVVHGETGLMTECVFEVSNASIRLRSPKELQEALEARKEALGKDAAKDVPVFIEPLADVAWRHVIEAFNAALKAEFKNIGFT